MDLFENKISNNLYKPDDEDLYEFIITIYYKDFKKINYNKITNDKYCEIFTIYDKVIFNDIKYFELYVLEKKNNKQLLYIKHIFNCDDLQDNYYTYTDNNIYIEFNNNLDDYYNCCCYLKRTLTSNDLSYFYTPPNY